MKTVNVSQRSSVLNDLLKRARRHALVLKLPTGEEFVLARLSEGQSFFVGESDDFDVEIEMTRKNKAFMKFLDGRGAEGKKKKSIPAEEVRRNLGF